MLDAPLSLTPQDEKEFVANNAQSYLPVIFSWGSIIRRKVILDKAIGYYEQALKHEVSSLNERKSIREK